MENAAFCEEDDFELINGRSIMMLPRPSVDHNRVVSNVNRIFQVYLRGKRCEAFSDGVEVHFDEDNVFVPDAMIVCNRDIIKRKGIFGAPDLVVEVLSPRTTKNDRGEKKGIYEKYGVREYWLADPLARSIEVYVLQDGKFRSDNVYHTYSAEVWEDMTEEERAESQLSLKVSLYDDFVVDVREVFERVGAFAGRRLLSCSASDSFRGTGVGKCGMEIQKRLPVGIDDFKEMRENCYFVDSSG